MEQEKFGRHTSSAERRETRRRTLNMGVDVVSKTPDINSGDREVLLEGLLGAYVQGEITDMVNDAFSPQALTRVIAAERTEKPTKSSEDKQRKPLLERAKTMLRRH